jgi:hypothetical protein
MKKSGLTLNKLQENVLWWFSVVMGMENDILKVAICRTPGSGVNMIFKKMTILVLGKYGLKYKNIPTEFILSQFFSVKSSK